MAQPSPTCVSRPSASNVPVRRAAVGVDVDSGFGDVKRPLLAAVGIRRENRGPWPERRGL